MDRKDRGFTLGELLIAVAIIAVLVAIAIPIFNTQLEKSREAVDLSNVRAAYTKVMSAAISDDHGSPNIDGVTFAFDRWYINVDLKQHVTGWQGSKNLVIGGISHTDPQHWVGEPSANGFCTISYSVENGAVLAWEYNFAQIMNNITIHNSSVQAYNGKTVTQLLKTQNFPMLESSGGTGKEITSEIKHQLGMNNTNKFSYKILPSKTMVGPNLYEIYVSTERDLTTGKKNISEFGEITVTGYIYRIEDSGASTLIKAGTPQVIKTYTNAQGQEKMDVYGDQNTGKQTIETYYKWNE